MIILYIFLGAIFGSFLNVLIHRMPLNKSIILPSSHCPKCKESIMWYNNIPIISYLLLKGKSSCCNKHITLRYPIVELLSSLLWVWSYFYLNTYHYQILFLIISSCLLVIFFTDYNHFFIPVELNFIIFLSALLHFLIFDINNMQYHFFSMIVLSVYFLVLLLLSSYLLKKETMGYGDIILIAVTTFWVGLIDGMIIIFIASIFSIIHWIVLKIITKDENIILPFGSAISLAAILLFVLKHTFKIETNLF